jgi:hypothetical protein
MSNGKMRGETAHSGSEPSDKQVERDVRALLKDKKEDRAVNRKREPGVHEERTQGDWRGSPR